MIYWPGEARAASALGAIADRSVDWPGIPDPPKAPTRLIIAGNERRFDSLVNGRVPPWTAAVAIPSSNLMIVRLKGDPARALRHELAHLALHSTVRSVPRWFDEGYAAWASGEWDRLEVLRVNWELARGSPPHFDELDRDLENGGAERAEAAYAFASTAVALLARIGGERGIAPLIEELGRTSSFEAAMRKTYAVTVDHFEELWQQDLRRRYGWLSFLASAGIFWGLLTLLMLAAWWWRRRRDRERRLKLDEGWELPPPEDLPSS